MIRCTVSERGNGFPVVGDYVPGDDGELYRVEKIDSRIFTARPGGANWIYATVSLAAWADCPDGEEVDALAIL